jgi:alpha-glutamyl/putrescinyl thymine pyrophosphorylase clade 1
MQNKIDMAVAADIKQFWDKAVHAFDYRAGLVDKFETNDFAVQADTEYFGPNVTMDDRLRYLGNNISNNKDISEENKVLNLIVTHFYGGRDCHRVLNAEMDPKKAYTDFRRALTDKTYVAEIKSNLDKAKKVGYSIWSTTELHTSLMGAMNKFAKKKFGEDTPKHAVNMIHWLSGWIEDGTVDKILNSKSLKECVGHICSKEGVGSYYGYHGGTDQSSNRSVSFTHDEPFVLPGPGCQWTLRRLFPDQKPTGAQVVWLRENQHEIFGSVDFKPFWHNIEVNGQKVFDKDQTELSYYSMEVALCQWGIYKDIQANPAREARRKIKPTDVDSIINYIKAN